MYYFNGTKCFRRFLDRDVHSGRSLSGEGEDLCIGGAAMAGGSRHGQQKCNGMIVWENKRRNDVMQSFFCDKNNFIGYGRI